MKTIEKSGNCAMEYIDKLEEENRQLKEQLKMTRSIADSLQKLLERLLKIIKEKQ